MNATTATAQQVRFVAGDVVTGRPVFEGKAGNRRKGIVLGTMSGKADDTNIIVWWYGLGAASMTTTTMAFARELTKAGDIFNFSGRQAAKLARECYNFSRANTVGWSLTRHAARMRSIGA
jgi:uncharacterized protein DUF6409